MGLKPVAILVAFGCSVGCGADARTEVIVVVDTDLDVPGELDALTIVVTGPDGTERSGGGAINAADLPSTLGLVHEAGPLGPFDVEVSGSASETLVTSRRARFTFVRGQTLVLEMHLARACLTASCASEQTCTEDGCAPIDVPPEALRAWTGTPPRIRRPPGDDAGSGQDACATAVEICNMIDDDCDSMIDEGLSDVPELCNMLDDDCDSMVDEGFDLTSDLMNCGACGTTCVARNGTSVCSAGVCLITSCDPGFDDCDGSAATGCEVDLNMTNSDCGACGNRCRNPDRNCCGGTCQRDPC